MSIQLIFRIFFHGALEWDNVALVVHASSSDEEKGSEGWMLKRFLPNLCNLILGRVFLVRQKNLCHLPNPCSAPASSLERCKRPWHCNHCSAIKKKKNLYYQTCLFSVHFPKSQLDTVNKINSTQPKTAQVASWVLLAPKGDFFFFPLLCAFS